MSNRIIRALLKPEAYDEKVGKIKLLQTHISWVFLTGKFVYKIKKPVNFGFLDFSTLAKRKFYCNRELEINKKFSPDIYLAVLPIIQSNGKIKIGGKGKVIEYVLKMKELPQTAIMSKLLEKNKIDKKIIDLIAKQVANYHSKAERNEKISRFGSIKTIKFNSDENFSQTEEFVGKVVSKSNFDYVKKKVNRFLKNEKLFAQRIKENKIKWCHGDLHSGNIFVVNNKIYIFDAIEFNERFACSDIALDIAFLAMDLDFHLRRDLSNYFVKKYIEYSKDKGLLKLLDFYKCYRAIVRFKINVLKTKDESISGKEKQETTEQAKKYFNLALEYAKEL